MKISSFKKVSFRRAILPASIIAAMAMSGSANAFKIDTGNEDLDVRWDNTVRYNAGWRMQDQSWDIKAGSSFTSSSANKFQSGDMVTNRLDVLSEFDFIWKKDTGFRVSGAGWYDKRYDNHELIQTGAGLGAGGPFFPNGTYPDEIQRYYNGPSGEFLDAFVFTKFDLGDVPVNVKLGQHTIYWGEAIFSLADGVSSGQSYADLRKALATPGAEAKEIFKPLNQFSFSAQLSPELTVMGQYFFDWKPDLFPLGGTYFSPADFLTYAGTTYPAPGGAPFLPPIMAWNGLQENGLDKSGDWGLAAKWRPEWLDGTAGLYYREYTPKNGGALALNVGDPATSWFVNPFLAGGALDPTKMGTANGGLMIDQEAPRTKMVGFSLAKQVWGISWGLDLTYRQDATLQTQSFITLTGAQVAAGGWAPIGDIYTGVFNMIAYDGKRGIGDFNIYDSAVLTAELNWDGIDKVTKNNQNMANRENCVKGSGAIPINAGATNQGYYGCQTGNNYGITVLFEPKWFQVWPGTDVTLPLFYTVGLHGNSAVAAVGTNEGMGAYSIGITADVDAQYNFALRYNGNLYKRHMSETAHGLSGPGIPFSNASLGDFSDKNWLSFTAKATW